MALKVLIVDDSVVMRNTMKAVFAQMKVDCDFIEAVDGTDALLQLAQEPVELVLLDWNMPKLSGLEFTQKIRSVEKFKDLPIIMVTGNTTRDNVIEAVKSGVTDYVTKPINASNFIEKLAKLPLFAGCQEEAAFADAGAS